MQQRTGIREGRRRTTPGAIFLCFITSSICFTWMVTICTVPLEQRKNALVRITGIAGMTRPAADSTGVLRYSDHFSKGKALFDVANKMGWRDTAKRKDSYYEERRSQAWLKIKMTQSWMRHRGYTIPRKPDAFRIDCARFVDKNKELIHVAAGKRLRSGDAGQYLQSCAKRVTSHCPFPHGVDALRKVHWINPNWWRKSNFRNDSRHREGGKICEPRYFWVCGWTKIPRNAFSWRRLLRKRKMAQNALLPQEPHIPARISFPARPRRSPYLISFMGVINVIAPRVNGATTMPAKRVAQFGVFCHEGFLTAALS